MPVKKISLFFIYLITFLVYTQGYWERFTPIPIQTINEIFIILLMAIAFRPKKSSLGMMVLFVLGLLISIYTGTVVPYFKYIRFVFYFYVIYSVLWSLKLSVREFSKLVNFYIWMVLLQGVASVINLIGWGRIEGYVGCMSSLGGSTATAFPLFVFSILLVIYYFSVFKKRSWYYVIVLMIASVFLMAYSSGKRAVYIYIPLSLVIITIICVLFVNKTQKRKMVKKLFPLAIFVVIISPAYFFGIRNSGGYSDRMSGYESNKETVERMLEFVEFYENAEYNGQTVGRSNTTLLIMNQSLNTKEGWLVGHGFGSIKDDDITESAGIGYGAVGYTRDVFSGGIVFASLVVISFLFLFLYRDTKAKDRFSKIMRFVVILVFVVIHFTYSPDFTVSLKLTMILPPLLCFINSSNYTHIKLYYSRYLIFGSCLKMNKKYSMRSKKIYINS